MSDVIRVFIGYDHAESVAFHTLYHSIMCRSSLPVQITPIQLSTLKHVLDRPRDPMQSNEFAFSRWLVPYLCDFEGWAIFMDCDMLVLDDIAGLWSLRDDRFAVQVVKHKHRPQNTKKYLGTTQTSYEKKNWSSVMLFNCSKCTDLSPEYVNVAPGLDLHQFKWLGHDDLIGDIPLRWNYLVDWYRDVPQSKISNLHYTEGGPYFADYVNCDHAEVWWDEWRDMNHCQNASVNLDAIWSATWPQLMRQ